MKIAQHMFFLAFNNIDHVKSRLIGTLLGYDMGSVNF